jgi:predicted amidohydrolase YtcJ
MSAHERATRQKGIQMKFISRAALAAAVVLTATSVLSAPRARAAATLIENVSGYTLAGGKLERFGALVFDEGKVVRTGEAAALRKAFPAATVVDGHGKTLLPGLIDAHGHVIDLGFEQSRILLTGTSSLKEAQDRIRAYVKAHPGLEWYRGRGWNQVIWKLGRFPLASELDAVIPDRPAVLGRIDGHAQWVNSKALKAAGITRATKDPVGGRIERDAQGNPSGVLVDKAMDLMDRVVPEPSDAERIEALKAAVAHMNSVGLTSAADAGVSAKIIDDYRKLADQGALNARIYAMIGDTGADFMALSKKGPLLGYGQDHLTVRSVKLFADGALGSRGAALLAPYSDKPDQKGLLFETDAAMEGKIQTALKAGYQVNVHAIGDAGNRQVLDGFEAAYKAVGGRELRNRIEHAQIVALSDIPRFKQLNLIASMQPTHATSDMNMAEDRIGAERLKGAYAWRSFLKQGTIIAAGSDFPVESDNPFFGLYSAVTRMDHEGRPPGGWHPEQAMTLTEAFRAFTLDAAYADHQEKTIGSLEPGKWADFILIDRDLFKVPPADIWKIKVEQTWVGGKRVY